MGINVNRDEQHIKRNTYGVVDPTEKITELLDAQAEEMARRTGDPDALKGPKPGMWEKMKMKVEDKLSSSSDNDMGLRLPRKEDLEEFAEGETWDDNISAQIEEGHKGVIGSAMHSTKDKFGGTLKNASNKVKSKIEEKVSAAWEYTKEAVENKFEELHNKTKMKIEDSIKETFGAIKDKIIPPKKVSKSESAEEPLMEEKVPEKEMKEPLKENQPEITEKKEITTEESGEPSGQFTKKLEAQKDTIKEGLKEAVNSFSGEDSKPKTKSKKQEYELRDDFAIL